VADSREVWINVYGIPLHVWDEPLFKKIGSLFGTFIDFDEDTIERRRLDVARIKVSTKRRGLVDEVLNIKVMGVVFRLWVVEERGGSGWRLEWREVVVDEASSVSSREGVVLGEEAVCFSEEEGSPRPLKSTQAGPQLSVMQRQEVQETRGSMEVQRNSFIECQPLYSSKGGVFSNDPIVCCQVEVEDGGVDKRREELEKCIRSDCDKGKETWGLVKGGKDPASHALKVLKVGGHVSSEAHASVLVGHVGPVPEKGLG
jgi:hypothetical protein